MATTVTSKGQVTIPKTFRTFLGIQPGDPVTFALTDDGLVTLTKEGQRPVSRFDALVGSAGPGPTTDELMRMLRGDPDE